MTSNTFLFDETVTAYPKVLCGMVENEEIKQILIFISIEIAQNEGNGAISWKHEWKSMDGKEI